MARTFSPSLAIILAGSLAAGLALARPATPTGDPTTSSGYPDATADAEPTTRTDDPASPTSPAPAEPGATYRRGNRAAGSRQGQAAASDQGPEAEAADPSVEPAGAVATIAIEGFAFTGPAEVAAGTTLAVTNRDGVAHTLSFRSGGTDTGTVDGGATVEVTAPDAPGTYAFFCRIHPSMQGEIEVTG